MPRSTLDEQYINLDSRGGDELRGWVTGFSVTYHDGPPAVPCMSLFLRDARKEETQIYVILHADDAEELAVKILRQASVARKEAIESTMDSLLPAEVEDEVEEEVA